MSKPAKPRKDPAAPFPLRGYLLLNAAAWLLSLAAFGATWGIVGDAMGAGALFVAMPLAFGAVSIFDAVCDRAGRGKAG